MSVSKDYHTTLAVFNNSGAVSMPSFHTPGMHGYACEWSSFDESRLAVASAQHFGVVGNGKQYVFRVTPTGMLPIAEFDTKVTHHFSGCGGATPQTPTITVV